MYDCVTVCPEIQVRQVRQLRHVRHVKQLESILREQQQQQQQVWRRLCRRHTVVVSTIVSLLRYSQAA